MIGFKKFWHAKKMCYKLLHFQILKNFDMTDFFQNHENDPKY